MPPDLKVILLTRGGVDQGRHFIRDDGPEPRDAVGYREDDEHHQEGPRAPAGVCVRDCEQRTRAGVRVWFDLQNDDF